jgi:hypothetical protein
MTKEGNDRDHAHALGYLLLGRPAEGEILTGVPGESDGLHVCPILAAADDHCQGLRRARPSLQLGLELALGPASASAYRTITTLRTATADRPLPVSRPSGPTAARAPALTFGYWPLASVFPSVSAK